jgi:hypothetical protein
LVGTLKQQNLPLGRVDDDQHGLWNLGRWVHAVMAVRQDSDWTKNPGVGVGVR